MIRETVDSNNNIHNQFVYLISQSAYKGYWMFFLQFLSFYRSHMAGPNLNEWASQWVMDWCPSGRRGKNKKTDKCKMKIAHSWERPCVVSLIWLELKSAVTLACRECLHQLRLNERARADGRDDSGGVQSKRKFDNDPGAAKIGSLHSTTHLHCPNTRRGLAVHPK